MQQKEDNDFQNNIKNHFIGLTELWEWDYHYQIEDQRTDGHHL